MSIERMSSTKTEKDDVSIKRIKTPEREKSYGWLLRKLLGKIIGKLLPKNYRKLLPKNFEIGHGRPSNN